MENYPCYNVINRLNKSQLKKLGELIMKTKLYVNNMVKAIGNKEMKDNFENYLLTGFQMYFPRAIEVVIEDELEVYVNDIPLIENIIDFIKNCNETDETLMEINWIHEYADKEGYVKQVIPFKVKEGQREYVCPRNR